MIDTNKYEGHPPAPWGWRHKVAEYRLTANGDKDWIDIQVDEDTDPTVMTLIADAPLLLAEVKRLRRELVKTRDWVKDYFTDTNGDYKSVGDKISHYDFMQEMERIE